LFRLPPSCHALVCWPVFAVLLSATTRYGLKSWRRFRRTVARTLKLALLSEWWLRAPAALHLVMKCARIRDPRDHAASPRSRGVGAPQPHQAKFDPKLEMAGDSFSKRLPAPKLAMNGFYVVYLHSEHAHVSHRCFSPARVRSRSVSPREELR
jgi:hypothetical protein